MSAPLEIHLKETKRILRYVKGTLNFDIHYLKNKDVKLIRYNDSDWGLPWIRSCYLAIKKAKYCCSFLH